MERCVLGHNQKSMPEWAESKLQQKQRIWSAELLLFYTRHTSNVDSHSRTSLACQNKSEKMVIDQQLATAAQLKEQGPQQTHRRSK